VPLIHGFPDEESRIDHFDKHGSDFDSATPEEYERAAVAFLAGDMTATMLECIRSGVIASGLTRQPKRLQCATLTGSLEPFSSRLEPITV
jgi:hypothetical protein